MSDDHIDHIAIHGESALSPVSCKHCGHNLDGPYCSQCGLKVVDKKDRTLRRILSDFIASLFLVENKVYRSFKYLFISPSTLPRSFIEGDTIRFVRPIQFFLLANLIYYLAPQVDTFNTNYRTQMQGLPYSEWIAPKVNAYLDAQGADPTEFARRFDRQSSQVAKLVVILLAPLMGLVLWLMHFRRKQFYAGDHIAVALYLLTFNILSLAVLLPIGTRIAIWLYPGLEATEFYYTLVVLVVIASYMVVVLRHVYTQNWVNATSKAVIFTLLYVPMLHVFRFLLLIITLGVMALG